MERAQRNPSRLAAPIPGWGDEVGPRPSAGTPLNARVVGLPSGVSSVRPIRSGPLAVKLRRKQRAATESQAPMLLGRALLIVPFALWLPMAAATQGLRVVDVVNAGDAASEREHDYAGEGATAGVIDGRAYRQARGWLSYSMAVYEDTEVTLSCVFRGTEGRSLAFGLLVDGRPVKTHTVVPPSSRPAIVDLRIPFEITKGLTVIHVMLRAVDGPAPALFELRTVQEHLERPSLADIPNGVPSPTGAAF